MREIETKLFLDPLPPETIRSRLIGIGFVCEHNRAHEYNLVFDDPLESLRKKGMLLRLRRYGEKVNLTLKKPAQESSEGIKIREEIEIEASRFEPAQEILLALGYTPWFEYEKFREIHRRNRAAAMLDETPMGLYLEIEADEEEIPQIVRELGFSREQCIADSYHSLWRQRFPDRPMIFPR